VSSQLRLFLRLSSCLTSFELADVRATGMSEKYLLFFTKSALADTLERFFKEAESILQASEGDSTAIESPIAANMFPRRPARGVAANSCD
jgi:hypothetical protein